jgi:hypothetical protein
MVASSVGKGTSGLEAAVVVADGAGVWEEVPSGSGFAEEEDEGDAGEAFCVGGIVGADGCTGVEAEVEVAEVPKVTGGAEAGAYK